MGGLQSSMHAKGDSPGPRIGQSQHVGLIASIVLDCRSAGNYESANPSTSGSMPPIVRDCRSAGNYESASPVRRAYCLERTGSPLGWASANRSTQYVGLTASNRTGSPMRDGPCDVPAEGDTIVDEPPRGNMLASVGLQASPLRGCCHGLRRVCSWPPRGTDMASTGCRAWPPRGTAMTAAG